MCKYLLAQASPEHIQMALAFMRTTIGLLTIGHGLPKMMGGSQEWQNLGTTFMSPIGIHFWPIMWGFLGACTEFFGGIALVLGLGLRFANFALIIMMLIATIWHIQQNDSFMKYSFPLSLICVFLTMLFIGGDKYSLDYYLVNKL